MYSDKKARNNTMQIRVLKNGGKRSTWLIGHKKKKKKGTVKIPKIIK
jgi:hypothetical protein